MMRRLQNVKIGVKLIGGFCMIATLTLLVAIQGWWGVDDLDMFLDEIAGVRMPSVESLIVLEKEAETILVAQQALLNPRLSLEERKQRYEDVAEAREHYLASWKIYESLPHTAEESRLWNQFVPAWEKFRDENNKVFQLSRELDETGILNPVQLRADLQQFRGDHHALMGRVRDMISSGSVFYGGADHTACNFGRWLGEFESSNPQINQIITDVHAHHTPFHQGIARIKEQVEAGNMVAAQSLLAEVIREAENVFEHFDELLAEAGRAEKIYLAMESQASGPVRTSQAEAYKLLGQLIDINNQVADKSVASSQAASALAYKFSMVGGSLGVIGAVILGFIITRSITRPLHRAFGVIEKYSQGDTTDQDLDMGDCVNCSILNNCNQQECPNFGREGYCWVEAGTFGPTPVCHKLTTGVYTDCRQCKVYNIKDEFAELGSMLVGMAKSLRRRSDLAQAIARGDLTHEVKVSSADDQLGNALKTMLEGLREMVGGIQIAGEQIASGSGQVADASQALSQGATESASSLEEVSASMNQMASQVRSSAESANAANQLASQSKLAAEKGDQQMAEMVAAMTEINQAGQNISKIIKVIDEIAFQTNLLALNAAVEAARAGQHGKGFAVVAEEVRNLAARSAKAAEETAELIEGSVALTDKGSQIADHTAGALKEIMGGITKVSDLLEEIATASSEQAQGINEVTTGLGQIDQVTQQNTASAEQCAAAAEELSGQAEQMRQMLQKFKLHQNSTPHQHVRQAPQRSLSAAAKSGWGEKAPAASAPKIAMKKQIALDDDEFGKF